MKFEKVLNYYDDYTKDNLFRKLFYKNIKYIRCVGNNRSSNINYIDTRITVPI